MRPLQRLIFSICPLIFPRNLPRRRRQGNRSCKPNTQFPNFLVSALSIEHAARSVCLQPHLQLTHELTITNNRRPTASSLFLSIHFAQRTRRSDRFHSTKNLRNFLHPLSASSIQTRSIPACGCSAATDGPGISHNKRR